MGEWDIWETDKDGHERHLQVCKVCRYAYLYDATSREILIGEREFIEIDMHATRNAGDYVEYNIPVTILACPECGSLYAKL